MMSYWGTFARTGQPNNEQSHLQWDAFDPNKRNYIRFDLADTVSNSNLNYKSSLIPDRSTRELSLILVSRLARSHGRNRGLTVTKASINLNKHKILDQIYSNEQQRLLLCTV